MAQYEVPTPSTLILRLAEPERARAALQMLAEALPTEPGQATPAGTKVAGLSDVASAEPMLPVAACVVLHEGSAAHAWILRFAVAAPFRRRGLGRRLLAEIGRAMQHEGAQRLWAMVGQEQVAFASLLAGAAFVRTPEPVPSGCPVPPGAGQDDLVSWWVRDL